jgi:dolichol kinase
MIAVFYLWKDLKSPVPGMDFLVLFAWVETAIAVSVDIIRFYVPSQNEALRRMPFYGKLMRSIEGNHFNGTTYYVLAAAILITAYWLGWCQETTLVISLAVLGVADPSAAWARHQFEKHRIGQERAVGLLAFLASSFLAMWTISWWMESELSARCLLCIGVIVALVETYTTYGVALVRPLTRRFQKRIAHQSTLWLFRLYPDDNLLIPLMVAILAGVLSRLT